jgi:hypothetical protein
MDSTNSISTIPLIGLVGDNPLAFLASVGTLRTLSQTWPTRQVRMSWHLVATWQPVLHVQGSCNEGEIVQALVSALSGRDSAPEFTLGYERGGAPKDLAIEVEAFTEIAGTAARAATVKDRNWSDFCAAYGSDAFPTESTIQDTAFRTMSGAGHQHFLEFMRKLAKTPSPGSTGRRSSENTGTDDTHICSALFAPWTYEDPGPAMRWDPRDDRRYALRADNPSASRDDPIRTMRGANRLAIEALPCFPTAPAAGGLLTAGFLRDEPVFSWPIWEPRITLPALQSLLLHPEVVSEKPRRDVLGPMGVVEIFRSRRITMGRYRNFTPAVPCWGLVHSGAAM